MRPRRVSVGVCSLNGRSFPEDAPSPILGGFLWFPTVHLLLGQKTEPSMSPLCSGIHGGKVTLSTLWRISEFHCLAIHYFFRL